MYMKAQQGHFHDYIEFHQDKKTRKIKWCNLQYDEQYSTLFVILNDCID